MPSTIVQIPFTGGVNQRIVAEYVDPSTALLDVINGQYAKDGAVDKRLGVAPLTTTQLAGDPTMGSPVKLLSRGTELLATDGDSLFSYAPDGSAVWAQRALISGCVGTRTGLLTLPIDATCVAFAEGSGRRVVSYRRGGASGGSVYARILDAATNAVLVPDQLLANGTYFCPIPVYAASHFFVFYTDASKILCAVYSPNGVLSSNSAVVSDIVGDTFDATPEVGGPGILLFYPQVDGTGVSAPCYARLESLPAVTVTASATLATGVGTTTLCACRYDGALGVTWFCYESNSSGTHTLHGQAFDLTWTQMHAVFAITASMPGYSTGAGGGCISVEPLDVKATSATTHALFLSGSGFGPGQTVMSADGSVPGFHGGQSGYPDSQFAGKPFRATVGAVTRCYVPILLSSSGSPGSTCLLADTMALGETGIAPSYVTPRPVAVIAPRQCALNSLQFVGTDGRFSVGSGIGTTTAGSFRTLVGVGASEEFSANLVTQLESYTVYLANFDFTQTVAFQYAEGNGETFTSGGVASFYDAACMPATATTPAIQMYNLPEVGFFSWPNVSNVTGSTGGGGHLTLLGLYAYQCCWAQQDANGLIHRSAFGIASWHLTTSENTITLTVQSLEFSGRFGEGPVYLEVYRTQANLSTFYFVGAAAVATTVTPFPSAITFVDTTADNVIASNPLAYTTGGVLDSVCPPSSRAMVRHVDRLWLIDDTGLVIWFSTPFGPGDAVYFNETLTLQFTTEPLTAIGSMDDKLVVFSAQSIWYVEGYGPPNTGLGSDLTTAVSVPSETGSLDWRSIVTVPSVGIFFQSGVNGLPYLLDRGLGVTCVGLEVQDWFAGGVTVLAASQVPNTTEVRFILSSGYVAVYSTTFSRWSRYLYPVAPVHAVVPLGGAWCAAAGANVYQEQTAGVGAFCLDTLASGATQWITTSVKLAHVKPGGIQGAGQLDFVQGFARPLDPANVTCQITYDYGQTTESRTYSWQALATGSPAAPGIVMWRMQPYAPYSQPMAAQVTLSDGPPTGGAPAVTGQGMRWIGVAFSFSLIGAIYDKLGSGVKQ